MAGPARTVAGIGAVLVAAVLTVVVVSGPASAHTTLVGSSPSAGQRLAYAPDEIVLTFGAPVSPSTVRAELRSDAGEDVVLTPLVPGEEPVSVIAYGVPRLSRGVYGLSWLSVGPDGHRVVGEILFGVGTEVAGTTVEGGGALLPRALDLLQLGLRVAWYACLALLAGLAVIGVTGPHARVRARQLLGRTAIAAAGVALVRAGTAFAVLRSAGASAEQAVAARGVAGAGVLGLVLAVGGWVLAARASEGGGAPSRRAVWWPAGALLATAVVGATLTGHAPDRPDPVAAITFGALHLGAAALWTGPVIVLLLVARGPRWRALEAEQRRDEVQAMLARFAPAAGWALAVVGASGMLLAARTWEALQGGVLIALIAKVAVVTAVAAPLGLWHHRTRRRWEGVPRTVRVEAVGLVLALVLGGVLVGWDPGWSPGAGVDPAVAAILDGTADDPELCQALDVGRAACYRATLTAILVADGPAEALEALVAAQQADAYVADNCHQVSHDLGNDAAERISDMSVALAVDGSACWSGYYHGFIEARLAAVPDDALVDGLPTFCDGAADPAYSFTHYNCLHGLGHGLMLRVDADLFEALPLCDALPERWLIRSCASGAFMENVMAAQQGLEVPGVAADDLLYPCTEVTEAMAEDCYLMQTSTILWRLGGDVEEAFGWCDRAAPSHRSTCYRSMGRDISSIAALDAGGVVERCDLGEEGLVRWCIDGAASNAVYEQAGREAADALCEAVVDDLRTACTEARDLALATIALG